MERLASGSPQLIGAFGADLVALDGGTRLTIGAPGEQAAAGALYLVTEGSVATEASPAPVLSLGTAASPGPRPSVRLHLAAAARVTVEVFDMLDRRLATPVDGPLAAGDHLVALDATGLPAGLYLVRAQTETVAITRRLTVVR